MIEPSAALEESWVRHHDETASANLISKTNSWYNGANVPGKPRRVLSYTGGVGTLRIPIQSGHRFRFEAGRDSDLKPATIPR